MERKIYGGYDFNNGDYVAAGEVSPPMERKVYDGNNFTGDSNSVAADGDTPPATASDEASQFIATLNSQFPWMAQIGLDANWFQIAAAESGNNATVLLAKMRETSQFKARFPGMYRSDGSLRMNEAQYLTQEASYRQLLRQFGYDMTAYDTPVSLVGLFESEQDPNEFQSRLQTFSDIKASGQATKDAFYVYAGITLSDEDLYQVAVDPASMQHLSNEYNKAIATSEFDYEGWITRATSVGLDRVANVLGGMQARGAVTGAAVQAVLSTDSGFARTIMDSIYTGGSGNTASTLSLEQLMQSFEYAAVGAAATKAGLELPTRERIGEIRQAGIDQTKAKDAYLAFGSQKEIFSGAVQRAGFDEYTQDEFEQGQFLGNVEYAQQLSRGLAGNEAAGKGSGEFRFSEEGGRISQRGFGVR